MWIPKINIYIYILFIYWFVYIYIYQELYIKYPWLYMMSKCKGHDATIDIYIYITWLLRCGYKIIFLYPWQSNSFKHHVIYIYTKLYSNKKNTTIFISWNSDIYIYINDLNIYIYTYIVYTIIYYSVVGTKFTFLYPWLSNSL